MQNFVNHLKKYIHLTEAELQCLSGYVKTTKVAKKSFLLDEGQVCKANYFVEKGLLRMFFVNSKGVEQVTQFALENWWLSDYMSYTLQAPAQFSVQAVEHSEIIVLYRQQEVALLKELPQLEHYFRIMMQRAYAAAQMRVKYFHDYSKEENYRIFASMFPAFVQRIPQYMLASYLGLTPEYLSELRKKHP